MEVWVFPGPAKRHQNQVRSSMAVSMNWESFLGGAGLKGLQSYQGPFCKVHPSQSSQLPFNKPETPRSNDHETLDIVLGIDIDIARYMYICIYLYVIINICTYIHNMHTCIHVCIGMSGDVPRFRAPKPGRRS